MKILVDADACPCKEVIQKVAEEKQLPLFFLLDTTHVWRASYGEVITISKGNDAVDFALVNRMDRGDVCVTQDYGVAAMVLGKGGYAIHQSGKWYTSQNIDQMLFERHLSKKQRNSSRKFHGKGPKKRTEEDNKRFEESFRKLVELALSKKE